MSVENTDCVPGPEPPLDISTHARQLVSRLLKTSKSQRFSAVSLIARFPHLKNHSDPLVDLAYEDFRRKRESGESIGATVFVGQFPEIATPLYNLIKFDEALRARPSLVDGVSEDFWPRAGEDICGFHLIEQIGKGALSRVFVASEDRIVNRHVVVKVCIRGEREANLLGQLQDGAIAPINSVVTEEGTGLTVICMPFQTRATMHQLLSRLPDSQTGLSGRGKHTAASLRRHIAELNRIGDVPLDHQPAADQFSIGQFFADTDRFSTVILKWGIQLAHALRKAHTAKVLHCDVKPGNVLLLPDLSVSLLDFNLAFSESEDSKLAGGTLPYMASEQLFALLAANDDAESNIVHASDAGTSEPLRQQNAAANPATDVYGLCATLWHMAVGCPPFGEDVLTGGTSQQARTMLARQQAGISADRLRQIRKVLPQPLVDILLSGLSFEARARPESVDQLAKEFSRQLLRQESFWKRSLRSAGTVAAAGLLLSVAGSSMIDHQERLPNTAVSPASELSSPIDRLVNDGWRLFSEQRYEEATKIVAALPVKLPAAQNLDLHCRTCQLPALRMKTPVALEQIRSKLGVRSDDTSPRRIEDVVSDEEYADLLARWESIAAEWSGLSEAAQPKWQSLLYVAYIQLELGQVDSAIQNLRDAESTGLPAAEATMMKQVAEIRSQQLDGQFQNQADLQELHELVLSYGTRGAALAYLDLALTEAVARFDFNTPELELKLVEISDCFREPRFEAEAAAVWKLFARTRLTCGPDATRQILEASEFRERNSGNLLGRVVRSPHATHRLHPSMVARLK